MKKISFVFALIFLAASLVSFGGVLHAQPVQTTAAPAAANGAQPAQLPTPVTAAPPSATPAPLAPIANQIGQTIQTLVGAPATLAAQGVADISEDNLGQISDTFATGFLDTLNTSLDDLKTRSAAFLATCRSALPDFSEWLDHQSSDPLHHAFWIHLGDDLFIIVGIPFLIAASCTFLLLPLRLNLRYNKPATFAGRIGLLIGLFAIRIIPVFLFLGCMFLLLDQNEPHKLPRYIILNFSYALALAFMIKQIWRGFFAPTAPHLRLVPLSDRKAVYAYQWLNSFSFVIIYSYFLMLIMAVVRIPNDVIVVYQDLLALLLTLMALTVIIQTRAGVASIIRGHPEYDPGLGRSLRLTVARYWSHLAILYLFISLAIVVLAVDNGFELILRGTLLSVAVLATMRFAFIFLNEWQTPNPSHPALVHRQLLAFIIRPALWVLAVLAIAATWGLNVGALISTVYGHRLFSAAISVAVTLFILTVLYEMLHASIERYLGRRDEENKLPVASARARTLLPMVRNSVFILFSILTLLTFIAAAGFNIGTLLAGAGVIGVAIGFGSQTLIKDFLTGLFIVTENTIAVGDVVTIGTFSGVVEALSVRTLRLRDVDGSLHILPFSEVTKITNMSKGFGYAVVDISVSYDSDIEHVMAVIREVGAKLQEDPLFKRVILEPIEVMGIESLDDSAIKIRSRIRTRTNKQWDVKRLLTLQILKRFKEEHIEIPFPTVTHIAKPSN